MTLEFTTLKEPIQITDPVEATFTEYRIYGDIRISIAKSTIDSVYVSGLTPEEFVLREIIQNAIDSEILKIGNLEKLKLEDFLWAYKKVKVKDLGKWKLVENEGTLDEDIFFLGYSTKEEKEGTSCSLVGRFGIGLKESIFVMLYYNEHILMAFNGHIYGFGYYYNGQVYYDLSLSEIEENDKYISPVIFRGKYNVKDRVLVYVPASLRSKIPLLYPYDKPYHISSETRGMVYHNGIYSGKWNVPLDINICKIKTDQYRSGIELNGTLINSISMIADNEMSDAFKKILLKNIIIQKKVMMFDVPFDLRFLFEYANEKLHNVLQRALNLAVEELAKTMNEKVIIVDRDIKITTKELPAIALPDIPEDYINNVRSYLTSKGYKVFAYSKNLSKELLELYDQIAEPDIPVEVKAMIRLAEWLYSIGVEIMKQYEIPGWSERLNKVGTYDVELLDPLPGIFDIDVKIVKPQYNDLLTDSLGVTFTVNNKSVIVLRNLPKDQWLLYVGIMIHELNHVYTDSEHGTFEWEIIYDVLYMVDAYSPNTTPYITNLIRLAIYNPELFLKVKLIAGLPPHVLPVPLVVNGECHGYIDYAKESGGVVCDAGAPTKLKLVNNNGALYLEVEPE